MKNFKLLIALMFAWTQISLAQSQVTSSPFKRTTATILFSSIGGGVLGLSTLSFYGKPQEHTDNITIGVLLGFLSGVGYVVYDNYKLAPANNFSSWNQEFEKQKKITPTLISWSYDW